VRKIRTIGKTHRVPFKSKLLPGNRPLRLPVPRKAAVVRLMGAYSVDASCKQPQRRLVLSTFILFRMAMGGCTEVSFTTFWPSGNTHGQESCFRSSPSC
jgi:hypothetical protein